jgi:glycine/D-amino acid oxidase-like deaminating enzyme
MSIERVVVVGGGVMGNGIAQVVATSGLRVTLVDVEQAALARARARLDAVCREHFVLCHKDTPGFITSRTARASWRPRPCAPWSPPGIPAARRPRDPIHR